MNESSTQILSGKALQIFREKSRAFYGSAKVSLDKLQHEELPYNPRQKDDKNIERLVRIFRSDGCDPLDPENHVPVLVSRRILPREPFRVGDDYQVFDPDQPLVYLEGRHRIEAARKFLEGDDRWWVVDLYSDDLNDQVKNEFREHDPNCAKFYDGDILRQILISTMRGDNVKRGKWMSRLSTSKQDCVKRLEALPPMFCNSLNALIPFAGLWPTVLIGAIPRLSSLHCPEEMTRCLRRVKETLVYIIGENEQDWLLIDPNTVHLIEGRCPGLSLEDRRFCKVLNL
ncbi:hypothetical protein F5884DRAFT_862755 [Xylogone sp. PMI_703]|nr:hypothetical protein F5884DRAFT_862755 [Xylogone sp. PMI_703]